MAADRPHRSPPHSPVQVRRVPAPLPVGQGRALGGLFPQHAPWSADMLRALQRTAGNQVVQQLLRQGQSAPGAVRRAPPQPSHPQRLVLQRDGSALVKVDQDVVAVRFKDSYFANLRQHTDAIDQAYTDDKAMQYFTSFLREQNITLAAAKRLFGDVTRCSYKGFNFLAKWNDTDQKVVVTHIDYSGGFDHALFRDDLKGVRALDRNVIFGLDGRDEEQLCKALELGYRAFDMALSYKNTASFAKVLGGRKDISRNDVWLTYKFDIPPQKEDIAKDVEDHLSQTAKLFGGYLDVVLIHNLHPPKRKLEQTLIVMKQLKQQQVIRHLGVSNLYPKDSVSFQLEKDTIEDPFDAIEVVENNASPLTENSTSKSLAKAKKLAYYGYNVMPQSLRQHSAVVELAQTLNMTPAQLLILYAERQGTLPVVSSSSGENMAENLYTPQLSSEQFDAIDRLMIAIKTKEKDQLSQTKIPSTTDSVRQLMMLLNPLSSGEFEQSAAQQYVVNLQLFKKDSNFRDFIASTIPPHESIDPDYHHINIETLLDGLPNNSCGTNKKGEALRLAASLYEVTSKKPIVSQAILQKPQQQSEVIEIDD